MRIGHMHYTHSHEWILFTEKKARVGISNYAQQELGEIVYIELPQVGEKVSAGEALAVVESTKEAKDIYSPLAGTIIEVNQALLKHPALINQAAETEGWIALIEMGGPHDGSPFLSKEEYLALL